MTLRASPPSADMTWYARPVSCDDTNAMFRASGDQLGLELLESLSGVRLMGTAALDLLHPDFQIARLVGFVGQRLSIG